MTCLTRKWLVGFPFIFLLMTIPMTVKGFNPLDGPLPIGVYIDINPWSAVLGVDAPQFVLYEDQTVIFFKQDSEGGKYYCALMQERDFDELRERLEIVASIPGLRRNYNMAPHISDAPKSKFYFHMGNGFVTSTVYAMQASPNRRFSNAQSLGLLQPHDPPDELLSLYELFKSFEVLGASEWIPHYIEVMIWPYDYAPDESIHWPKDWPGLESDNAVPWGDAYSIYLPGGQLPALQEFLATRRAKGAVEISKKKWAISWKHVFPSEHIWRRAFMQIGESNP